MPDLIQAYEDENTLTNVAQNYKKHVISQSGVGRELIVSVNRTGGNGAVTDDLLEGIINYMTLSHGADGAGDSAFTVGGFGTADGSAFESGTTETVFLRLQGTGELTTGDAETASGDASNTTIAIVCEFVPAN